MQGNKPVPCFVFGFVLFFYLFGSFLFFILLKENTHKLENLPVPPGDLEKRFLFIDCSAYKLRTNQKACRQPVAQAAVGQSQILDPVLTNGLGTFISCNYLIMQMKEGKFP